MGCRPVALEDAVATNDNRYYVTTSANSNSLGNIYLNTTGTTYTTYTTTYPISTGTTFTWNGDPNTALTGSRIFQSMEERVEYQQEAYIEPRDHAYNPDSFGTCGECKPHNLHRYSPEKHLFIIEEEIPWSDRLAS